MPNCYYLQKVECGGQDFRWEVHKETPLFRTCAGTKPQDISSYCESKRIFPFLGSQKVLSLANQNSEFSKPKQMLKVSCSFDQLRHPRII